MPTNAQQIVSEARRLTKLEATRRKLRRELRVCEKEIKLVRTSLRALASTDPFDQLPPQRLFGEK